MWYHTPTVAIGARGKNPLGIWAGGRERKKATAPHLTHHDLTDGTVNASLRQVWTSPVFPFRQLPSNDPSRLRQH